MEVLDTSVVYKWYIEEKGTKEALSIFRSFKNGETKISIPDLVFYELTNVLRFNSRNTAGDIIEIIDNLSNLNLDIVVPTRALLKDAVRLAYKYDITIYDAVFVALAQDLGYRFITADKKLYRKIKGLRFVNLLEG